MAEEEYYETNVGKIVNRGTPPIQRDKEIETATNCYPGRLVKKGTTDYEVVVNDGVSPPEGWLGWEQTESDSRPATVDTIYTVNTIAKVLSGGSFAVTAALAANFAVTKGDYAIPWAAGTVAPAKIVNGQLAIRVPMVFNDNTQKDTGIDFISGMTIGLPQVYVTTIDATETIDIGLGMGTESGHDADGLVNLLPLGVAGWAVHEMANTTADNITVGALLVEATGQGLPSGTPVYFPIMKGSGYQCNGTLVSLGYTCTAGSDTAAGHIFVPVSSFGTQIVGFFPLDVTVSTSIKDAIVESIL